MLIGAVAIHTAGTTSFLEHSLWFIPLVGVCLVVYILVMIVHMRREK